MLSSALRCFLLQRMGLQNCFFYCCCEFILGLHGNSVSSFGSGLRISGMHYSCCCRSDLTAREAVTTVTSLALCCIRSTNWSTFLTGFYTVTAAATTIYCLVLRRYCLGSTGLLFEPILTGFSRRFYAADARLRQVTTAAPLCG